MLSDVAAYMHAAAAVNPPINDTHHGLISPNTLLELAAYYLRVVEHHVARRAPKEEEHGAEGGVVLRLCAVEGDFSGIELCCVPGSDWIWQLICWDSKRRLDET
jgi:hypothetical protein